jgi:hypothetical protein
MENEYQVSAKSNKSPSAIVLHRQDAHGQGCGTSHGLVLDQVFRVGILPEQIDNGEKQCFRPCCREAFDLVP